MTEALREFRSVSEHAFVTSARVERAGAHELLSVWVQGALAGTLTLGFGQAEVVCRLLGLPVTNEESEPARNVLRDELPRITVRPDQMGGVPCVRDTRIPVVTVVRMVANGLSVAEILDLHPDLDADDVREALLYVAELVTKGARDG